MTTLPLLKYASDPNFADSRVERDAEVLKYWQNTLGSETHYIYNGDVSPPQSTPQPEPQPKTAPTPSATPETPTPTPSEQPNTTCIEGNKL